MPQATPVERVEVGVFVVPTDAPEADGTMAWQSTTLVLATAFGGGTSGVGYTYSHAVAGLLMRDRLAGIVIGQDVMDVNGAWHKIVDALRNLGTTGLASDAVAAVDTALWDLKARVLGVPLASLLGRIQEDVPVYGSGGFTSYDADRLVTQLGNGCGGESAW